MSDDPSQYQRIDGPTLLGPLTNGPAGTLNLSAPQAQNLASDALLIADWMRMAPLLEGNTPLSGPQFFSLAWLVIDTMERAPPTYTYYSHGFEQHIRLEPLPITVLRVLPHILLGELGYPLGKFANDTMSAIEAALKVPETPTWASLGIALIEAYFRTHQSATSAELLGTQIPIGDPTKTDGSGERAPGQEGERPIRNDGDSFRSDDPSEIERPIPQPGFGDDREFDA